jgi:hypothetical protein
MHSRDLLSAAAALVPAMSAAQTAPARFQLACMILPYSPFPFARALTGIRDAGFRYVAWSVSHNGGTAKSKPVIAPEASAEDAERLASRCRSLQLEPLMMFETVNSAIRNLKAVAEHAK